MTYLGYFQLRRAILRQHRVCPSCKKRFEIKRISLGISSSQNHDVDVAMRVVADHVRTIAFSIADGQLPSNANPVNCLYEVFYIIYHFESDAS